MRKFFRILLVILIIALFLGTLMMLYKKSKKKPVIYETESPTINNIVKKTVATGSIVPRDEILIKPQVSGILEKVYIEAGQFVKAGDLIAKVRIIPNMVNLNEAESRVAKAKLNFEEARLEYNRQKKLFEQGVIPQAEFENVRIAFETAKEEQETAENNLQIIKEGVAKRAGQATNTLVKSTISGMVLDVPVKEGNSVIETNTFNEGTTIASVADMGEMIFEGKIDETEVGKIKNGMDLILTVGAIENETFNAKLEYISPKGNEENGAIQFAIKAAVELRKDFFIRAGYSATADIVLDRRDSVMVIPESLLRFEEGNDTMYVEVETADQVYEKRVIKTGLSDGVSIEVLEGLSLDDKIKGNEKIDEKLKNLPQR
ncbi:MAG: efflux RND transporter periplasmic adaptor subunit [Bacteroidales bacterium]|nr:efflux RND transporter periplasmic adaptor subunit [Bacteroidales bacterium]